MLHESALPKGSVEKRVPVAYIGHRWISAKPIKQTLSARAACAVRGAREREKLLCDNR